MASSELAATYAALILADEGIEITADKIIALTEAASVEIEPIWAALLAKALEGKNVKELLLNVGSGGGGPAPAVGGATGAGTTTEPEKEEEKKEEEKEESDDDMKPPEYVMTQLGNEGLGLLGAMGRIMKLLEEPPDA